MEPGKPDFNYLPFKVHNNVVYLAGQLAKENGLVKNLGRVTDQISVSEAERQVKICAQHAFSWLEIAAKDKLSKQLFENIISFRELAIFWSHYSEADYLNARILNN